MAVLPSTPSGPGATVTLNPDGILPPINGSLLTALGRETEFFRHTSGAGGISRLYSGTVAGTAPATSAHTANVLRAIPFTSPRGGTIATINAAVTTGVAGNLRLGIYTNTSTTDLRPGTLLAGSASISTAAAGLKTFTFGTPIVLDRDALYWLAIVNDVSVTCRVQSLAAAWPILGYAATLGTTLGYGWSVAFAYAALPASFPVAGIAVITALPLPLIAPTFSA
ncbi:MAG: hypothetical protein IT371_30710 [Deltaproteobacteria bacterium]|nr:hypothetical protein [Deltaproteobacteria bacterium]